MFGLSRAERVKRHHPIDQLIRSYGVDLKRQGAGLMGRCPFHDDKNPSLSVTPDKGLFHCFGCNAAGTVIHFVAKKEGISEREASARLYQQLPAAFRDEAPRKDPHLTLRDPHPGPLPGGEGVRNIPPLDLEAHSLLAAVCRIYHESFKESPAAQRYLEGRSLSNKDLWLRYQVGYCEGGKLKDAILHGSEQEEQLRELGLLNDKGNESFYKCVTFPIQDERGAYVGLYGRSIEGQRQLYLKGPHKGVWNGPLLNGHDSVILTESILDAFSLLHLGQLSVMPLYGAHGFTPEHLRLLEQHNFKEAILALDNDEAGRQGSERLREKLARLPLKLSILQLPEGVKDPNELLQKGADKEAFEKLLAERVLLAIPSPQPSPEGRGGQEEMLASSPNPCKLLHQDADLLLYEISGRRYRLGDLRAGRPGARVRLTVSQDGRSHTDRTDLYTARARRSFAHVAAAVLGPQAARVEADLSHLIEALEDRSRHSQAGPNPAPEREPMSAEEERSALEYLRAPDLLARILADVTACGYVGQDDEKLLCYLSAVSRITPSPIHLSFQGSSSTGKSELMEKVAALFPPEQVEVLSFLTPKSLYYLKGGLKGKLLVVDEKAGAEGAEYPLRSLMSRGKLSHAYVEKDPRTGASTTRMMEVEGPCVVWDSSSEIATEDNRNRVFEVWLDESPEQTALIHAAQKWRYSEAGRRRRQDADAILKLHRNVHRLLAPLEVTIPYLEHLGFPKDNARTRRDHARVLALLAAVTLLHQQQRETRADAQGRPTLTATLADYSAAHQIACKVLRASYSHVQKEALDLLETAHARVQTLAHKEQIPWQDYLFSRREIREWTGTSEPKTRRCLGELVRMEYLLPAGGGRGRSGLRYKLAVTPEEAAPTLSGLISPAELAERVGVT